MLRQEINFYHPTHTQQPAANFLSWRRFLYSQVFFLSLLTLIYFYNLINLHYLEYKKNHLTVKVEQLKKQFFTLKNQFPAIFFARDVSQSIETLEKQLETQAKILQSLQTPISFAQNFSALSHTMVPNVWLTKISISNHDQNIILQGKSTAIATIQRYIKNINTQKEFSEFNANLDSIESNSQEPSHNIQFQITMKKK